MLLKFFSSQPPAVTDDEIAYYRANPDEIDEVAAPSNIHRLFLTLGLLIGASMVALSRVIAGTPLENAIGFFGEGFLVDIIFESGVALIGAALTAYFLGVLLKSNQANAQRWRKEIRRRIRDTERGEGNQT